MDRHRNREGHEGQQNPFGRSNRFCDRTDNRSAGDRGTGGGNYRGRGGDEHRRDYRGGYRGGRGGQRGQRGGYNRFQDEENGGNGFKKFVDTNVAHRRNSNPQNRSFKTNNFNGSKQWYHDNQGHYANPGEESASSLKNISTAEPTTPPVVQQSAVGSSEPSENKEPKLLRKIKTEKIQPDTSTPKPKSKKTQPPPKESSSSSESSSEEEEAPPPVKNKSKDKVKPASNVKIKKEAVEKKEPTPVAAAPPPPSTPPSESSSESSSSEDSSSGEDEIPKMPAPIKSAETPKPKKERKSEEDVVCLGKMNNIENLVDDDEGSQSHPCVVCNKVDHPSAECQMKCKKCSHTAYECHVVCKNCGETYGQSENSAPQTKQPPNPFVMFMQFMQLCMSQYNEASADIKYPFPQFESPSAPVLGPTPTVEVTRKDIANSKRDRKRAKSVSKQSKKRHRASMNSDMHSESDSDSSSNATTTKKRKKHAKSVTRESQTSQQTQQQTSASFGRQFPGNMSFPGAFNAPGFNPMMAFSQMMGYNPAAAMNFTR